MFAVIRVLPRSVVVCRCNVRQYSQVASAIANPSFIQREKLDVPPDWAARLADREWVPGGLNPDNKYPEFIAPPKPNFPALYEAENGDIGSAAEWAKAAREIIESKLVEYGVIMFRGMPVYGGEGFSEFLLSTGYSPMGYEGGLAVRQKVAAGVLTASDDLPEVTIQPHNEMAYSKDYPHKLFFYCQIAPAPGCGGETGLTRVKDILPKLDPKVVDKFRKLGVKYNNYLPSQEKSQYKSWQETFFTEDRGEVEKHMARMNYEFEWQDDGAISYAHTLPVFHKHHTTGEELWFTHVTRHHATNLSEHPKYAGDKHRPYKRYPYHTTYGDGTEIEPEVIQHIRDVIWQVSVGFQMQERDLLVYDNMLVQHSRLGFTGKRKLLAAMTSD
ncbi:dapdiamide synthesis protein DdaC-like [Ptychodera flava]|uniref:dapdiamide synthesis protein DdaC-like n=1 Tax=Ptychodera flava TaxID=63121 RepID=UPI003969EA9C